VKITKTLLFFAVPISLVALVLTGACTKNASKSANNTETAVSSTDTGYQIAIFNAGEKVASLGSGRLRLAPLCNQY
jgi:hypothetical protein